MTNYSAEDAKAIFNHLLASRQQLAAAEYMMSNEDAIVGDSEISELTEQAYEAISDLLQAFAEPAGVTSW